jgi:hypothetical protein
MMSDTPRTDAAEIRMERLDGDFDHVVHADFGRQLERELAAAHKKYNDALIYASNAERYLDGQLAAAQRDAERYRWLRQPIRGKIGWNVMHYATCNWLADLDAAIDAAMAKEAK